MFCFSNSFRFLFVSCFDLIGFLSDLESTWKGGPGSSSLPWLPRHHQVVSSRFRSLPSCYWVSLVERRSWYRFVAMVTSTPPRYRVFRIMAFGCLFFFCGNPFFSSLGLSFLPFLLYENGGLRRRFVAMVTWRCDFFHHPPNWSDSIQQLQWVRCHGYLRNDHPFFCPSALFALIFFTIKTIISLLRVFFVHFSTRFPGSSFRSNEVRGQGSLPW